MEEAERLCDRVAVIDHGRIVDIDTPAGLVRRHCPERTIVLTVEEESSDRLFQLLKGVRLVTRSGVQLTIEGAGDDLITQVIQCVSEHRVRVTDFRTVLPTLEDVFLKLTGHSIRD
jgi:ABC-2 type transport system ATP-binding protein